jgi:hypothetical protein
MMHISERALPRAIKPSSQSSYAVTFKPQSLNAILYKDESMGMDLRDDRDVREGQFLQTKTQIFGNCATIDARDDKF